jgi:hypothetical protein
MFGERSPFGAQTVPAGGFGYDARSVHNLEREYNKLLNDYKELCVYTAAWRDMVRDNLARTEEDKARVNEEFKRRVQRLKNNAPSR